MVKPVIHVNKKTRPRPQIESPENIIEELSEYLHSYTCIVPGCSFKLHKEEAEGVIKLLQQRGYIKEEIKVG